MTVGFCGDLKFGRTVHSLISAMSRYTGTKIVVRVDGSKNRVAKILPSHLWA